MVAQRALVRAAFSVALGSLAAAATADASVAKPGAESDLSARLYALSQADVQDASRAEQAAELSLAARGPGSLLRGDGSLVVEVRTSSRTRDRVAGIRAAGAGVVEVSPDYRTITATVSPAGLRELAAAPGVVAVTEVLTPVTSGAGTEPGPTTSLNTCTGAATSEADMQLGAATARSRFEIDGAGVKVGVLSDSYDQAAGDATSAAQDVSTGDIPGPGNPCGRTTPVQVLDDSVVGADEGRGMAQLVHDVAPGADLAFATAFAGSTAFASNIRALEAAGSEVIVDDVTYFDEPFFQDGPIAVAVNDVTAQGVVYYSSAGNNNVVAGPLDAVSSFEAPAFRQSASCPAGLPAYVTQCMDFNPGAVDDNTFGITVPNGRTLRLDLQYAQPWNGVTTDLNAYVLGTGLLTPPASENSNVTTQKPFEFLAYTNNSGVSRDVSLVINRYTGVGGGNGASPRIKFSMFPNGGQTVVPNEYTSSSGGDVVGPTIFGHNGAENAMSTAAVRYDDATKPEPFSSRGPVTHYFAPVSGATPAAALPAPKVLSKPDIAATDGGRTTFFTPAGGGIFRFFGTSAAAPHAAAVAALQLTANPSLNVAQVKAAQRSTAVAVGAFGQNAVGSGLLDAVAAVAANPPPPPTVTGPASPGTTQDVTPTFTFSTTGRLRALTCQVDSGAANPCTSPFTTPALADGPHTLTVRATDYFDQAGTGTATVTVNTVQPDTTPPDTAILSGPRARTKKRSASLTFSSEPGAGFACSLNGAAFASCTSPATVRGRKGKNTFEVRATDAAGNADPTPAKHAWTVKRKKKRRR